MQYPGLFLVGFPGCMFHGHSPQYPSNARSLIKANHPSLPSRPSFPQPSLSRRTELPLPTGLLVLRGYAFPRFQRSNHAMAIDPYSLVLHLLTGHQRPIPTSHPLCTARRPSLQLRAGFIAAPLGEISDRCDENNHQGGLTTAPVKSCYFARKRLGRAECELARDEISTRWGDALTRCPTMASTAVPYVSKSDAFTPILFCAS